MTTDIEMIDPAATPGETLELQKDGTVTAAESPATALARDSVQKVSGAITGFNAAEAGMAELEKKYAALVVVDNPKGLKEAAAALAEIRAPRFAGKHLLDGAKKLLNQIKDDITGQYDSYAKRCLALEQRIVEQVDVIEAAKATKKAAEEQAERDRVEAHRLAIEAITQAPLKFVLAGADDIQVEVNRLQDMMTDELDFEEFAGQATRAKEAAMVALNAMLVQKRQAEEDAKLAEQTRQQQAAQQATLDAQAAELQRQQDAIAEQQRLATEALERTAKAERQAAADIQTRIDLLAGIATTASTRGVALALHAAIQALEDVTIDIESFGPRVEEATALRTALVERLQAEFTAAEQREQQDRDRLAEQQRQDAERDEEQRKADEQRAREQAALQRAERGGPMLLGVLRYMVAAFGAMHTDMMSAEQLDAMEKAAAALALMDAAEFLQGVIDAPAVTVDLLTDEAIRAPDDGGDVDKAVIHIITGSDLGYDYDAIDGATELKRGDEDIDLYELVLVVETEMSITIPDEAIPELKTVNDLIAAVKAAL